MGVGWQQDVDVRVFRALTLVDADGEGGFAVRQIECGEAAWAVVFGASKPHAQATIGLSHADADVAIEQTELVVVLLHDDGTATEPVACAPDMPGLTQQVFDAGIEQRTAPLTFAQGAQPLLGAERRQCSTCDVSGIVSSITGSSVPFAAACRAGSEASRAALRWIAGNKASARWIGCQSMCAGSAFSACNVLSQSPDCTAIFNADR